MTSLLKEPIIPFVSGNDIRNNMGNTALLCLVCLHITEPFSVEGIGIFKESCRTAEDFCITGPSKTLISLWCLKNIFWFYFLHKGNLSGKPFFPVSSIHTLRFLSAAAS